MSSRKRDVFASILRGTSTTRPIFQQCLNGSLQNFQDLKVYIRDPRGVTWGITLDSLASLDSSHRITCYVAVTEMAAGGSDPLNFENIKKQIHDLGAGVDDLNDRVLTLEHYLPGAKLQKELVKSKQEVSKLTQELRDVKKEHEQSTKKNQQEQAKFQEKIQNLEKEVKEKKAHIERLEREVGCVKGDLELTKTNLQNTAEESAANTEELASTKQELAATKNELAVTKGDLATTKTELGGAKNKIDQHTKAIESMNQAIVGLQRTTGSSQPVQCTDDAAAHAVTESGQRGQRQSQRNQPQHTGQTSLNASRSPQRERREQAAGHTPQAQPPTPRQQQRKSSFM